MKKIVTSTLIVSIAAIGLIAMLGMSRPAEQKSSPPDVTQGKEDAKAGNVLYDLKLIDMSGEMQDLGSLIKGKTAIISIWATWCPSCKAEIPVLNALSRQFSSENVQIVGVSVDRGGPEAVRSFAESNTIEYPVLMDDGTISNIFNIRAIPTSLIIDRQGNLVEKKIGYTEEEYYATMIRKLR